MKKNIYILLAITSFNGCGGGTSNSGAKSSLLSANIPNNILVVEGMKKDVNLFINTNKKDVSIKLLDHINSGNVALDGTVLKYWSENSVGSTETVSVEASNADGWKSNVLALKFETVSSIIVPHREVLKTGSVSSEIGKARIFRLDTDSNVIDPFGNIWENKLTKKAKKPQYYIFAKNRCEILRLTNKDSNWRLPSADELLNLIDYSKVSGNSMIDDKFEDSNLTLWAELEDEKYSVVSQTSGLRINVKSIDKYSIRCINAPKKESKHIISSGSGLNSETIDFSTGLIWSPVSEKSLKRIIDDVNQTAANYCATYDSSSGWRLPTINELRSLTEYGTIPSNIIGNYSTLASSTKFNNVDKTAKEAYYILGTDGRNITYGVSYADSLYPITCVKKK